MSYCNHLVLQAKDGNNNFLYVDLFRNELITLLGGNSDLDKEFLEYMDYGPYKSQENKLNFFCTYKENYISIRRLVEFYRDTAPLVEYPNGRIMKYNRTYDAAEILINMGIIVFVNEESKVWAKVFSKV